MTNTDKEDAHEKRVPSLVELLLSQGDIAEAIATSARAGKEALRKKIPTNPQVMIDMALVADAIGDHQVARTARAAAFMLRHPIRSTS